MNLSPEMIGLLIPAFIAGLIVASTHVPLGQEVLRRGIIFIDLAVAQIAALGVVFASVMFQAQGTIISFLFALVFALGAGKLFSWLEKKDPENLEALIGSTFVIAASLSILMLSNDPHAGSHMTDMLAGQVLWVSWAQILITGLVYIGLIAIWFGLKEKRTSLFYVVFPIAITFSVQLVGVYLVFASLIIPAIGSVHFGDNKRLIMGYLIAFVSFALGLYASVQFDVPSGPAIVCTYPVIALIVFTLKKAAR